MIWKSIRDFFVNNSPLVVVVNIWFWTLLIGAILSIAYGAIYGGSDLLHSKQLYDCDLYYTDGVGDCSR